LDELPGQLKLGLEIVANTLAVTFKDLLDHLLGFK
jgi:hypothetical protein